jgi:membrane protease YdiL (CAAX protease family)
MGLLSKYFLLTFTVSWICFIGIAAISQRDPLLSPALLLLQQALLYIGVFTPALVALFLSSRTGIRGETKTLLGRIGRWQVPIKWYVFAVGYLAIIKILVALIHRVVTGEWPVFGREAWYIMIAAILFSAWVQAGEEIGWRGFALPRLTVKFGLPVSTLLLGILWACWHLPLFFVKGADTFGQSFPLYLLQVTALSVAMGYLYWRTGGSLLLVMLMHAAVNNTKGIVSSAVQGATNPFALSNSPVAWLTVALLWVFAIYFLIRMRNVKQLN